MNIANAENIGIVVELSDGSFKTDCVNVPPETDGFEILEKSVFDILWSPPNILFGQSLCKINGEGTDVKGSSCIFFPEEKFWNFNILPDGDNEWIHSPVGHNGPGGCWNRGEFSFAGRYCGIHQDIIGYKLDKFGGDTEPPLKTYEQVCEKLKVKDIKVYVDGVKEAGVDEDGGDIDVVPGSKLEFKIEVKNLYDREDDLEIEEILIQGTLEDIDRGRDLDSEIREFDLRANRKKTVTLEFNIPDSAEEDDYDLIIEIEAENERGFEYFQEIEFKVEVKEKKEEFISFSLPPSELQQQDIKFVPTRQKSKEETVDIELVLPELKIVSLVTTQPIPSQQDEDLFSDPVFVSLFVTSQILLIIFLITIIIALVVTKNRY